MLRGRGRAQLSATRGIEEVARVEAVEAEVAVEEEAVVVVVVDEAEAAAASSSP